MSCRTAIQGCLVALAAALQLGSAALAQEAGRPRAPDPIVPASLVFEFQSTVGDRVFFGEGSADLGSRARLAIEAQAAWLQRNLAMPVLVEGHADDSGTAAQDSELSRARAEAVRRRLILSGVAPERIRIVAYGRQRVVADCRSPACAAQNRRAVTVVGGVVAGTGLTDEPMGEPRDGYTRRSPRRLF